MHRPLPWQNSSKGLVLQRCRRSRNSSDGIVHYKKLDILRVIKKEHGPVFLRNRSPLEVALCQRKSTRVMEAQTLSSRLACTAPNTCEPPFGEACSSWKEWIDVIQVNWLTGICSHHDGPCIAIIHSKMRFVVIKSMHRPSRELHYYCSAGAVVTLSPM